MLHSIFLVVLLIAGLFGLCGVMGSGTGHIVAASSDDHVHAHSHSGSVHNHRNALLDSFGSARGERQNASCFTHGRNTDRHHGCCENHQGCCEHHHGHDGQSIHLTIEQPTRRIPVCPSSVALAAQWARADPSCAPPIVAHWPRPRAGPSDSILQLRTVVLLT